MAVAGAGIWCPVIGASGAGYGFRRIALPIVLTAPGLPTVVGEVPTVVGNPLTGDGALTAVGKAHTKIEVIPATTRNFWQFRFEAPVGSAAGSSSGNAAAVSAPPVSIGSSPLITIITGIAVVTVISGIAVIAGVSVIVAVWWRGCGCDASNCTSGPADRGAESRPGSSTGRSTDRRARPRAEQTAPDKTLCGIVGISTGRQAQDQPQGSYARDRRSIHDSAPFQVGRRQINVSRGGCIPMEVECRAVRARPFASSAPGRSGL